MAVDNEVVMTSGRQKEAEVDITNHVTSGMFSWQLTSYCSVHDEALLG